MADFERTTIFASNVIVGGKSTIKAIKAAIG